MGKFKKRGGRPQGQKSKLQKKGEKGEPEKKPEYRIRGDITIGKTHIQILVQTYIKGKQVSCPFMYQIEGEDMIADKTADGSDPNEPVGTKVINVPFSSKKRRVTLHIVGGDADITTLRIPPHFKPSTPHPRKSFLQNLFGSDD